MKTTDLRQNLCNVHTLGVTSGSLDGVLHLRNLVDLEIGRARSVTQARRFADIEAADEGSLVVLEPELIESIGDYRFDVALRSASGLAAVLWPAGAWSSPSLTSQRIAEAKSIAFGELAAGQDALTFAVAVHELRSASAGSLALAVDRACQLIDRCEDISELDVVLAQCADHLGVELRLTEVPGVDYSMALRTPGAVPRYLQFTAGPNDAQTRPAAAYLAHRIETLLQIEFERNELPAVARAELLNEVLLTDAATSADAVSRLRAAEFPVDGSHLAVRIDCHEPLAAGASAPAVHRCQTRIAQLALSRLQAVGAMWTRAGTASSVLLISSQHGAQSDRTLARVHDMLQATVAELLKQFPELNVHVGVGTPHLGAGGLRTSVSEATTAVRTAKAEERPNHAQHFDRLGLGRALVRWAEIDGVRPVINEIMAPLLDQTPRQAGEAIRTLRAYLDSGQNVAKTAKQLHLHRNTVRYRIDRIAEVLPVDLDDPDDRLLVELSCRVVHAGLLS